MLIVNKVFSRESEDKDREALIADMGVDELYSFSATDLCLTWEESAWVCACYHACRLPRGE